MTETSKLEKLEKWKGALNKCIRCGYCYEHCPIYKSTRWEIDSPRGKLILLYGMLSGELEPSDYIANKIFECFHCNRCVKACSSGVPAPGCLQRCPGILPGVRFRCRRNDIDDRPRCVRPLPELRPHVQT